MCTNMEKKRFSEGSSSRLLAIDADWMRHYAARPCELSF
jgi:hypothetical protein